MKYIAGEEGIENLIGPVGATWPALNKISLALTLASALVWVYGMAWDPSRVDIYGLVEPGFPGSFLVAFFTLCLAAVLCLVSEEPPGWLCMLQLGLLILFLSVTSIFAWNDRGYFYAYRWWDNTEFVIQSGRIDESLFQYHSWPLTWILSASWMLVAGRADPEVVATWGPLGVRLALLAPLLLLMRTGFGLRGNLLWGALWVFYLGSWLQLYYAPQALGLLLFVYFMGMLVAVCRIAPVTRTGTRVSQRLIGVTLLAALVTAHALCSLGAICVAAALLIGRKLGNSSLPILGAVLVGAWSLYQATAFFDANVPDLLHTAFRLDQLATQVGERASGSVSQAHRLRTVAQAICGAGLVLLAAAGFWLAHSKRRLSEADAIGLWLFLGGMFLFAAIGSLWGREHVERVFLLSLPLLAISGAKLLQFRVGKVGFSMALLGLSPLFLVAHFGTTGPNSLSPADLEALRYFEERTDRGYLAGAYELASLSYNQWSQYPHKSLEAVQLWTRCEGDKENGSQGTTRLGLDYPTYIGLSDQLEDYYRSEFGDANVLQQLDSRARNSAGVALIYDNAHFHAFMVLCEGPVTPDPDPGAQRIRGNSAPPLLSAGVSIALNPTGDLAGAR